MGSVGAVMGAVRGEEVEAAWGMYREHMGTNDGEMMGPIMVAVTGEEGTVMQMVMEDIAHTPSGPHCLLTRHTAASRVADPERIFQQFLLQHPDEGPGSGLPR